MYGLPDPKNCENPVVISDTRNATQKKQDQNQQKLLQIYSYQPNYFLGNETNISNFAEFPTVEKAQTFLKNETCEIDYNMDCRPEGRKMTGFSVFSNSGAIEQFLQKSNQIFNITLLGVLIVSGIILLIAISRTIFDSKHEIAVFRAIGFSRFAIFQIYLFYAELLAFLIAIFAGIFGLLGAYIVDKMYSEKLTTIANYNFSDLFSENKFHLFAINLEQILFIIATFFAISFAALIIPALKNLNKNFISNLKDN